MTELNNPSTSPLSLFQKISLNVLESRWLILFFIGLIVIRTSFVFDGHLYWIDELRYLNAFMVLHYGQEGMWPEALFFLFNAHGRPGYVLLSVVPMALQLLVQRMNWISVGNPAFFETLLDSRMPRNFNPDFFLIPSLFNMITTCLLSFIFYKIARIFLGEKKYAFWAVVIYSLLANSNYYIRHLVPYTYALVFYLWALHIILRNGPAISYVQAIKAGLLSAFAYATYPTFVLLLGINGLAVFFLSKSRIRLSAVFITALSFILGCLEWLSRFSGRSYFNNSLQLSGSVNQGSFEEGYLFVFNYLWQVEGAVGGMLLVFFLFFLVRSFFKCSPVWKVIFGALIAGYLAYATAGVFLKKVVFYGRIIHMYMPFIVLGAFAAIEHMHNKVFKKVILISVVAASVISFITFVKPFYATEYPQGFKHKYLSLFSSEDLYEMTEIRPWDENGATQMPIVLVNTAYLYPIWEDQYPIQETDLPGKKLLAISSNPLNLPVYQFEGHTLEERRRLKERRYDMRIYVSDFFYPVLKKVYGNEK